MLYCSIITNYYYYYYYIITNLELDWNRGPKNY